MKTFNFQKIFLAGIAVTGLALSTLIVLAEDSPVNTAPPLSYGMPQILQLAQAKVPDDTIVAYIRNSGNSYGLNADQIIYLRQQGISDNIIKVMLTQPKPASAPAIAATQPENSYPAQAPVAYPQPAPTYQAVTSPTVYVVPNSQAYYYNTYYPYYYPNYFYSYYPYYYHRQPYARLYQSASFSFRYGGGFHGGSFGGGYRRGGGGYHGGGWHH